MRSASVPCGTRSTVISPVIIWRWVSGLVPMCETTRLRTSLASIKRPMPNPGRAVSLAITVSPLRSWRTSSPISRCGEPMPMKPPIINDDPSCICSTAADNAIPLCMQTLLARRAHCPIGSFVMSNNLSRAAEPSCQRYVCIRWRFADSCGRPISKQVGETTPELFHDLRLDLRRLQLSDGVDRLFDGSRNKT